jgi:hypothetical protein
MDHRVIIMITESFSDSEAYYDFLQCRSVAVTERTEVQRACGPVSDCGPGPGGLGSGASNHDSHGMISIMHHD